MENLGDWMNSTGKIYGLPFGDVTLLWEITILSPYGTTDFSVCFCMNHLVIGVPNFDPYPYHPISMFNY